MNSTKKVLLGVLIALVVLLTAAAIFVTVLLGRVRRVSVEDAAQIAQQEQEQIKEDIASGVITEEEPDIQDEITLTEEIEQTQLTEEELQAIAEEEKRSDAINVLLIGVDRRGTSGYSRSDTLLIATLDKKNSRLKLTSLMRDMYVPIPGEGENRINRSCAVGGPGLLMQTINENFSMDLTQYVLVDFNMFEDIVDKLGGITIEMSAGEVSEANDCIAGLNLQRGKDRRSGLIEKESGRIKLTGKQALGYSRIRHFGNGDYSRTSRQFKVLQAIYEKFMAVDAGKKISVLYDLLPLIETNMSNDDIISIMTTVVSMGVSPSDLMHYRLPAEGTYKAKTIQGMSVLLPDIPANAKALHEFIYNATSVEALPGSNTGAGTYHPKAYTDENGNVIDPNATPSPSPELPEEDELPEDTVPEETGELPEEPAPDEELPEEEGEIILPDEDLPTPTPDVINVPVD